MRIRGVQGDFEEVAREQALIFSGLFFVFLIMISVFGYKYHEDYKQASFDDMWKYRISQLSDDQIRDMRKKSYLEAQLNREKADKNYEIEHEEKLKQLQKCSADQAYKERNPWECHIPIGWISPEGGGPLRDETQNADQLYISKVMGICEIVDTVFDAKRFKCLPP